MVIENPETTLKNITGDAGMCGCGRPLTKVKGGVTHKEWDDEEWHSQYFAGLRIDMVPKNSFIPVDNNQQREEWESAGGGSCGPACIAVLIGLSVKEAIDKFPQYRGHASCKDMRTILISNGYEVKMKNGRRQNHIEIANNHVAIARIQWVGTEFGPYHGYKHWVKATMNTHYILINDFHFFCNDVGWLPLDKLQDYLKEGKGYITSYLEIKNKSLNTSETKA